VVVLTIFSVFVPPIGVEVPPAAPRTGIFVFIGVPSSLTKDIDDNCLEPNLYVLGVRVDRVDVVSLDEETVPIFEGVLRPSEGDAELSSLETLLAFVELC
jgi:hypothetical protein